MGVAGATAINRCTTTVTGTLSVNKIYVDSSEFERESVSCTGSAACRLQVPSSRSAATHIPHEHLTHSPYAVRLGPAPDDAVPVSLVFSFSAFHLKEATSPGSIPLTGQQTSPRRLCLRSSLPDRCSQSLNQKLRGIAQASRYEQSWSAQCPNCRGSQ
jgi:hypothetical protein